MREQPDQSTLRDVQAVPSAGASGGELRVRVIVDYAADGAERVAAHVMREGAIERGDWIRLDADELRYLLRVAPAALERMVE